jgi:hypothetical protein
MLLRVDSAPDLVFQRALDAFDACAFARRHGGYKESPSRRSYEFLVTCPYCGSDRLRWRHEPAGKQLWICWGCRRSGNSLALIELLERCETDQAIAFVLSGYVGGDAPTKLQGVKPLVQAPRIIRAMPWPDGVDLLTPLHRVGWDYVIGRGITPQQIRDYKIGIGRVGRLTNYVIFPCYMDGALVYWQGRAAWNPPQVDARLRKEWIKATNYRKTLNPTSEDGFATAADVVFNFDRARSSTHIVVCEGPVDAIKVGEHAVALFGKSWCSQKVERLRRLPAQRYTVYLDRGDEERQSALALAAELSVYAPTYIAEPPEGFDAGALSPNLNAQVVENAVPFLGRQLIRHLNR